MSRALLNFNRCRGCNLGVLQFGENWNFFSPSLFLSLLWPGLVMPGRASVMAQVASLTRHTELFNHASHSIQVLGADRQVGIFLQLGSPCN